MSQVSKATLLAIALITCSPLAAAERATRIARDAYACTSWAAWREYGQASLRPEGARASRLCPIRIAPGTKVVVIEEDAGEGASEIRYRGKSWFVDNQRLN